MKNIFYDGLNYTKLSSAIFALVPLTIVAVAFVAFVWLTFTVFDVQSGWIYRWRPMLAFITLWIVYGFAIRILLQFLSSGMLDTPGWQLVGTILAWPLFAWWAFSVI